MNNKGMTLVELIVTFSLLLIIIIGMFNLIMEVKFELDNKQIAKDFTEYSSVLNNDIHYDLLKNKPFVIAYKNNPSGGWSCGVNSEWSCSFDTAGLIFRNDTSSLSSGKSFTELSKLCEDIYPCAVYAYESGKDISFKTIALNKAGFNASESDLLSKYGIYYNGVYESIPDQEYVYMKDDPSIKVKNGLLIINYPFSIIEQEKNYGFKIAYPFS